MCGNSPDLTLYQFGKREADHFANTNSQGGQEQTSPQDHSQHGTSLCAQRHANPYFPRLQGYRVSHDAENPYGNQRQPDGGEDPNRYKVAEELKGFPVEDLGVGIEDNRWWDRLSPEQKDAAALRRELRALVGAEVGEREGLDRRAH